MHAHQLEKEMIGARRSSAKDHAVKLETALEIFETCYSPSEPDIEWCKQILNKYQNEMKG